MTSSMVVHNLMKLVIRAIAELHKRAIWNATVLYITAKYPLVVGPLAVHMSYFRVANSAWH